MPQPIDEFTRAYLAAALWSSTDDNGDPLDENYSEFDIDQASLDNMAWDTDNFQNYNEDLLNEAYDVDGQDESDAGHNFWLTRQGHGAGFWDGDYPKTGDRLTAETKKYDPTDLYVGDDGKLYIYGVDPY